MNEVRPIPSRSPRRLHDPMMTIDLNVEMAALTAEERWQVSGHNARTLVKHAQMRVILVAIREGTRLRSHGTGSSVTIQALRGEVVVSAAEGQIALAKGGVLALEQGVAHAVQAIEDSMLLLSVAMPRGAVSLTLAPPN